MELRFTWTPLSWDMKLWNLTLPFFSATGASTRELTCWLLKKSLTLSYVLSGLFLRTMSAFAWFNCPPIRTSMLPFFSGAVSMKFVWMCSICCGVSLSVVVGLFGMELCFVFSLSKYLASERLSGLISMSRSSELSSPGFSLTVTKSEVILLLVIPWSSNLECCGFASSSCFACSSNPIGGHLSP